ncbi:uncharacterized protein NEFER03_1684 [Nematocida sp. LUAm3]|nr:uncharacterized protein NEFER03_1684 [Nematocida sp. LUAm3]KAI5175674.1 uncharacterized protein NEFER02_1561 [Nematocida sp. LUAm2]KAI5178580.1 uncharacterized protein NEFER01_1716 [Nematocida sp. LUAm1]
MKNEDYGVFSSEETEETVSISSDLSLTEENYYTALLISKITRSIFCGILLSKIKISQVLTIEERQHIQKKDIKISTKHGEKIGAWILSHRTKPNQGWVLVLHGNCTNRETFTTLYHIETLVEKGFSLLIIDYRGFGDSEGSPSRKAFIEDVSASIRYLRRKRVNSVSILAYSLGTAVALDYLANHHKKATTRLLNQVLIKKVVLVSPFTSTMELLREYTVWNIIEKLVPESARYANKGLGFDSLKNISKVSQPIFIVHGTKDWLIPESHSKALSKAAHASLLRVENETHNSIFDNPITWTKIIDFLLKKETN